MGNAFTDRVDQLQHTKRQTAPQPPGELPSEIDALVDNKMYLRRHKKLQREHGTEVLLKLAELARTKEKPSHWYAKVTSVRAWERTLKMVRKLIAATKRAATVREKLGADQSWDRWYISVAYRNSEARVAGWLEQAMRGDKPVHLFRWLTKHAG